MEEKLKELLTLAFYDLIIGIWRSALQETRAKFGADFDVKDSELDFDIWVEDFLRVHSAEISLTESESDVLISAFKNPDGFSAIVEKFPKVSKLAFEHVVDYVKAIMESHYSQSESKN